MSLHIEEITWSKIRNTVSFTKQYGTVREFLAFRKTHIQITDMAWIKKQPVVSDLCDTLYNPQSPIIMILN